MNYSSYENKLEIDRYEARRIRKALSSYLTDLYINKQTSKDDVNKLQEIRYEIEKSKEMIEFLDSFLKIFF